MNDTPVKLMLVDDHPVIRLGLSALFQTVPHFRVVGEAATAADAIATARSVQPDVVIIDVRLPDGSGAEVCREIRAERPGTRVIMLTSYDTEDAVMASIVAGAAGYFLKETDPDRLVEGVEIGVFSHDGRIDDGFGCRVPELAAFRRDRPAIVAP